MTHSLKPLIHIGKNGLSDQSLSEIERALSDHELIKIKFQEYKEEKVNLTNIIIEKTDAALVEQIGNTVVLYRKSPDATKRKFPF